VQQVTIRTIATAVLIGLMCLSFSSVALGGEADSSGDTRLLQEILAILKDEGKLDEAKYEELVKKEQDRHDRAYTIKYSNGLQLKSNDGNVKLKIGGRIQADFASISPSNGLREAVSGGNGAGVEFRRARLYMSGELYNRIIYKAQYDFSDGPVNIKDLYIGMKNLGLAGTVRVGHVKEPFSLEELTSSKHVTFMERSLPTLFDSERNFGIVAMNDVLDQRLTYAFGVFAPSDDQGNYFSNDSDVNVTGRITGLPYLEDESRYLHLGLGFSYQFRSGSEIRYAQRPESHLAKKYLDTGDVESHGNAVVGGEIAWVQGPLSIQSEIKNSWLKTSANGGRANAWGGYGKIGYFLTGEHRAYKKKSAIFTRVNPTNPFDPAQGKWGAWEVAARYSYLDLNDGSHGLKGGRQQDITLGINWHLYSNVKLMTNYVHAIVMDTGAKNGSERGHANIFQMRAQIEF
jgi:phosphate-selective porin OprO/OprP